MNRIIRWLSVVTCVAVLTACSSSDNLEKPAPLVEFTPKIKVSKLWSKDVEGADDKNYNLQIGHQGNTLYTVGYQGEVYAINANTGNIKWYKHLHVGVVSGVSVAHNLAVVSTEGGGIFAMNAKTGKLMWQSYVGEQTLGLAAISASRVVIKTIVGTVVALNAKTGKKVWQYSTDAPQLILRGGSQPKFVGNSVVVGYATGKVAKLNFDNGTPTWIQAIAIPQGAFTVQRMIDITASPVINDGIIYATTYQGNIAALEVSTGQVVWNHKLSSYTGLALRGASLYVTDARSHVWKFQQDNGGVVWRQTALQARGITAPVLLENYVVVGDAEGYIHWMQNNNGRFVAREKLSSRAIRSAPVVIGNKLFVLDAAGNLAAYQINSR